MKKKKLITDSFFLLAGNFVLKIKGLIFLPIIIKAVGIEQYGVFVQLLINPGLIAAFCTLSLDSGFLRFTSRYDVSETRKLSNDLYSITFFIFLLALIGSIILFLLSPVINHNFLAGKYLLSARLSSLIVITYAMWQAINKYLKARKWFKYFTVYNLIFGLVPYIGFVIGVLISKNIFSGLKYFISLQAIVVLIVFLKAVSNLPVSKPSFSIFRHFLKYSWALPFAYISDGLINKLDRYFIGYFLGPSAIGIYNIIFQIASVLNNYSIPIRNYYLTYLPKFWDLGQKDKVKDQLREGLIYYLIIAIVTLGIIIFFSKPFILFILKNSIQSIPQFEVLIFFTGLAFIAMGVSRFFFFIIQYMKMTYFILIFQLVALIFSFISNYLLIPKYGLLGASISFCLSYFVMTFLFSIFFKIDLNFRFLIKTVYIFLAVIPIVLIYKLALPKSIFLSICCIFISVIMYFFSIFIFKVVTFESFKKRFL